MANVERLIVESDIATHEPGQENVAGLVVEGRVDWDPFFLDGDGFESRRCRNGCHGASVVALHSTDRYEGVAALRDGIRYQELQLADFVTTVC